MPAPPPVRCQVRCQFGACRRRPYAKHPRPRAASTLRAVSEPVSGKRLSESETVAVELVIAVRTGDAAALRALLDGDPELATARLRGRKRGPARRSTS